MIKVDGRFLQVLAGSDATKQLNAREFSGKIAFQIGRAMRALTLELETYQQTRKMLIEKHGMKDEDGKVIEVDGNVQLTDAKAFINELNELNDTTVEIEVPKPKIVVGKLNTPLTSAETLILLEIADIED